MATPLSADKMLEALRAEGVDPKTTSNWTTHNRNHRGSWGAVNGIVIHHTAGSNSLNLCINGTSSLPGPLCHAHLSKNGTLTLISNGRANHAGSFAQNAHNAVVKESSNHPYPDSTEPVDGNAHYYGIEIENLGNGADYYPTIQYDKAVRWATAICRKHGWTANSIIGHKEGTRRKIDPRGPVGSANGPAFDMDQFRGDVQARLNRSADTSPNTGNAKDETMAISTDDLNKIARAVWRTDGIIPAAKESQATGNTHAAASQWIEYIGGHVHRIEAKLEAQSATIQTLAQAIADNQAEVNTDELVARIQQAIDAIDFDVVVR